MNNKNKALLIGQLCQYKLEHYGKLIATNVMISNVQGKEYVYASTHIFPDVDKKEPFRIDMPVIYQHRWFPAGNPTPFTWKSDIEIERPIITVVPVKLVEITKKFTLKGTTKVIYQRNVNFYQGLFSHPTISEPELHWVREDWIEISSGRSYSQDVLFRAYERLKNSNKK